MGNPHLDGEALRELQVVMGDDFGNLLKTFVADSNMRIASAQKAAADADGEALRRAAHSFKGSSGNMGAVHLYDICQRIEALAHAGDVEQCLPLLAELNDEFVAVQRELKRFEP